MKIRKSTIVWFLLAAFFCYGTFASLEYGENEDGTKKLRWEDAVYADNAAVFPENEGKLVVVSGFLEVLEGARDPQAGVQFESPYVVRSVSQLKWNKNKTEWEWKNIDDPTADGDGWEVAHLNGCIKVGEFELDEELVKRLNLTVHDVKEKDLTQDQISAMEEHGYLKDFTTQLYFTEIPEIENLNEIDAIVNPEYEGAHRISWKIWDPDPEEGITIAGIQQGNMLTYYEVQGRLSVKNELMDKEEFEKINTAEEDNDPMVKVVFALFAVGSVIMGIRSLFKKKK